MNRRQFSLSLLATPLLTAAPKKMWVYTGTYTRGDSKGIYVHELDMSSGALKPAALAAETPSPSFLALHPNGKLLYAANELNNFKGEKSGGLSAFTMDPATGKLTALNQAVAGGEATCHLNVSKNGRYLLAASYSGGNCAVFGLKPDGNIADRTAFQQHTGPFGPNPGRQKQAHAHSINLDKANRYAVVADLGTDRVKIYAFNQNKGTLAPHGEFALAPGSGPRHFAFHPNGKWAYVNSEMLCTLTAANWDAGAGKLTEINTEPTMPVPVTPKTSTAETVVHPNGRFVYTSNRGHDSIAIFSIESGSGRITRIGNESTQGRIPRNFNIDPSGTFMIAANQESNSLVVFRIDGGTGKLTPVGSPVESPVPVCVKFVPATA